MSDFNVKHDKDGGFSVEHKATNQLPTQQPVDQPNLLRALIANDVLIRDIRHRDARWHDDEMLMQVLAENTRMIQASSTKRESGGDK